MMLRAFIAIEVPLEIHKAIAESTADLRKALPKPLVRWLPPQNVHLTLRFLGDISPVNLELLAEALQIEANKHTRFIISVGGFGAFPNPKRARIIWIGLEAPASLPALQRGTEAVCARLGYAPEDRPFSPHLTIGRVNQNVSPADGQKIRSAIEGTTVGTLGRLTVDALHIFKSDLQPTGAVYTHLFALPLKPA